MNKENDIDQLFKDKLSDPEIPFNELDWEKMEHQLDVLNAQRKKMVIPIWAYMVSGIAAVLIILLYWVFLAPVSIDKQVIKDTITDHIVKSGRTEKGSIPLIISDSLAKNLATPVKDSESPKMQPLYKFEEERTINPVFIVEAKQLEARPGQPILVIPSQTRMMTKLLYGNMVKRSNQPVIIKSQQLTSSETDSSIVAKKANALAQSKDPFEKIDATEIARSVQKRMENSLQQRNDLILSAMAAPDISFAKSSKPSKVSSNMGMLATYVFSPKISLTSGAVYSRKFYNYGGTSPQNSSYIPGADWQVNADCNVLDIPLNVNYKIFSQKKLSVSVNTGLSSYFMLKEKYQYTTGQGPTQQVSTLEINNQNQHLFGIANVSVSFDHQISPSVSAGVQPFVKLPLTDIGYTKASLKSAGVSFSLNIGLFPAKKPGKYAVVQQTQWQ